MNELKAQSAVGSTRLFGTAMLSAKCPYCQLEFKLPIAAEMERPEDVSPRFGHLTAFRCSCGKQYTVRFSWPPDAVCVYGPNEKGQR